MENNRVAVDGRPCLISQKMGMSAPVIASKRTVFGLVGPWASFFFYMYML